MPSWVNVIAAIWLIISPWVLGFSSNSTALWNAVILGVIVGIVALIPSSSAK